MTIIQTSSSTLPRTNQVVGSDSEFKKRRAGSLDEEKEPFPKQKTEQPSFDADSICATLSLLVDDDFSREAANQLLTIHPELPLEISEISFDNRGVKALR